jgi:hypothetical protein
MLENLDVTNIEYGFAPLPKNPKKVVTNVNHKF